MEWIRTKGNRDYIDSPWVIVYCDEPYLFRYCIARFITGKGWVDIFNNSVKNVTHFAPLRAPKED